MSSLILDKHQIVLLLLLISGDCLALGRCITTYRKQKKIMARGSEPQYCVKIMEKLESRVLGQLLAGAGGGGFCFALFKDPIGNEELTNLLEQIEVSCSHRFTLTHSLSFSSLCIGHEDLMNTCSTYQAI